MSVSNDGISRFESSVVYAPVTFADGLTSGSIVSNTIDAQAVALTLKSSNCLILGGLVDGQDTSFDVDQTYYLQNCPWFQMINVNNNAVVVLPDLKADGTYGVPNGVRLAFYVNGLFNLTFKTSVLSGAVIQNIMTITAALNVTNVTHELVPNNTETDPYQQYSYVTVTSSNGFWIVNGNIVFIAPP